MEKTRGRTLVEGIEFAALTDFQCVTATAGAAGRRTRLFRVGGAVCTVLPSEIDSLLGNRVVGLDADEPTADAALDAVEDFYAQHGAAFTVAGDLPQLAARGYRPADPWTRLVRDAEPVPAAPTLYAVAEVRRSAAAAFGVACAHCSSAPPYFADWAAALVGRSGWHCFAAHAGDTIVATAALYAAGTTGWLGFGATDPRHRHHGAQTALLAARINHGHELGLETLVTSTVSTEEPVSQSQRNVLRAAFHVHGMLLHWRSPAPMQR